MVYKYILFEHRDGVAYITINRPNQLNALNKATIEELIILLKIDGNIIFYIIPKSPKAARQNLRPPTIYVFGNRRVDTLVL